jgi:hypothetical protein
MNRLGDNEKILIKVQFIISPKNYLHTKFFVLEKYDTLQTLYNEVKKVVHEDKKNYDFTLYRNGVEVSEYRFQLLLDRFFDTNVWTCKIVQGEEMQVFAKALTGATYTVSCVLDQTILKLKRLIEERSGIPPEQMMLIHHGNYLVDSKTLKYYDIDDEDYVHIVLRLRGGGGDSIITKTFIDMDTKNTELKQWSKTAPDWRICSKGLCFEGLCENKNCKAYNQQVIVNMGIREFDYLYDMNLIWCPMCQKKVEPITCGFNNCYWKFAGQFKKDDLVIMKESKLKYTGDEYERFVPEKSEKVEWSRLKITSYSEDPNKKYCMIDVAKENRICVICLETIKHEEKSLECEKHCSEKSNMHLTCILEYKDIDSKHCIQCRASLQTPDDEKDCAICLEKVNREERCITNCQHIYHTECMKKFREIPNHPECLICNDSASPHFASLSAKARAP